MRIDFVIIISGLSEEAIEMRRESLQRFASPGTQVRVVFASHVPPSVESLAEMEMAAPGIIKRVIQSEGEGADAVVIWGGQDPSLAAAREVVSIPVVGPGMASMYIASALAEKFSALVQLPEMVNVTRRQIRDIGLENRCAGIYSADIPVLELGGDDSFKKVKEIAAVSIEQGGADAICLCCASLAQHAESLSEKLAESHSGAVVVHPTLAALRFAELLVGMGLTHSKRSYPQPRKPLTFKF